MVYLVCTSSGITGDGGAQVCACSPLHHGRHRCLAYHQGMPALSAWGQHRAGGHEGSQDTGMFSWGASAPSSAHCPALVQFCKAPAQGIHVNHLARFTTKQRSRCVGNAALAAASWTACLSCSIAPAPTFVGVEEPDPADVRRLVQHGDASLQGGNAPVLGACTHTIGRPRPSAVGVLPPPLPRHGSPGQQG